MNNEVESEHLLLKINSKNYFKASFLEAIEEEDGSDSDSEEPE